MEQKTQPSESKDLALVPLSIGQLEKAKEMSVDEIKSVFRRDSAADVESQKATAQMTEALPELFESIARPWNRHSRTAGGK